MKMSNRQHRIAHAAAAGLIVFCLLLLAFAIARAHAHANPDELTTAVYIVCTNDEGQPQASHVWSEPTEPDVPLPDGWRETIAAMVAGKVGDKMLSCQIEVSNAIYNELSECGWDMQAAVEKYDLYERGTPTAQTYEAVDQIFRRGEWMLDPEVLWFNDVDHPSKFHDSLVLVDVCDGVAFYKAHRPNVVPGGAAE